MPGPPAVQPGFNGFTPEARTGAPTAYGPAHAGSAAVTRRAADAPAMIREEELRNETTSHMSRVARRASRPVAAVGEVAPGGTPPPPARSREARGGRPRADSNAL